MRKFMLKRCHTHKLGRSFVASRIRASARNSSLMVARLVRRSSIHRGRLRASSQPKQRRPSRRRLQGSRASARECTCCCVFVFACACFASASGCRILRKQTACSLSCGHASNGWSPRLHRAVSVSLASHCYLPSESSQTHYTIPSHSPLRIRSNTEN